MLAVMSINFKRKLVVLINGVVLQELCVPSKNIVTILVSKINRIGQRVDQFNTLGCLIILLC